MGNTSILTIMIQLAKRGDADRATIKGLAEIKQNVGLAVGAFAALTGAAIAVDKALDQTVGVFVSYAAQVRELQRLTGATAEDTSRLIQAADDVTISYESLQKALWFAAKNGIEVNIDSIARLADEYNALAGPTEQAEFLAKKFGKGGADMGKLLEQGSEGVYKLTGAIEDGLVLTDAAVASARQYEIQTDNLTDSWNAFKIAIGQGAVPILNDLLTAVNNNIQAGYNWKSALYGIPIYGQIRAYLDLRKAHEDNVQATDAEIDRMHALRTAQDDTAMSAEALKAQEEAFNAELGQLKDILGGELGPAQDDYNAKMAEYTRLLGEAKTQKEKDKINANIAAETEEYNKRATAIMFNIQQEAILNSDMPDDAKLQMIAALGQAYGIYDASTANAIVSSQNLMAQVEAGTLTWQQAASQMQFMTQGVKEHTGATQSEAEAIKYVGLHAENSVTKFEAMEKAQADLAAGIRQEALPAVSSLNKQITSLPPSGTAWNYAFAITVSGSVPTLPKRGNYVGKGHGYENNPGVDSEFASGGQLQFGAGWTMVGEEGAELISPTGYVFSHTDSMAMLAGGMYPEYQRKYAGPVGEKTGDWGYYSGEGPVVQAARRKKRSGSSPPTTGGGSQSSQQSTAEVVAPLAASTEAAVQSAAAAQQQQVTEGIQTRNVIAQGNTDIADKLSETNDLLRNLNNTLPRSIGAAFQQANP